MCYYIFLGYLNYFYAQKVSYCMKRRQKHTVRKVDTVTYVTMLLIVLKTLKMCIYFFEPECIPTLLTIIAQIK